MKDLNNHCTIDLQTLSQYQQHLYEQEKSYPTIQSYLRSLKAFAVFLDGRPYTKETAIRWKETLTCRYAPNTVNAMLAAVNGFAEFSGCPQFKVKPLKIQRELFIRPERELTRSEYGRLVNAADRSGNRRLSLVLQTICATGIRTALYHRGGGGKGICAGGLQRQTAHRFPAGKAAPSDWNLYEETKKDRRSGIYNPQRTAT